MAIKSNSGVFNMNTHGVLENPEGRAKSNLVQHIIQDDAPTGSYDSRVLYQDIGLEHITPRSINQYKQNRIERLARSIRNTNNRLIHPIVLVRASDLPRDHEVLKRFAAQGVDVSRLEYIIVAGERRFRAWSLLRAEEEEKLKGKLGAVNPFDTITANILSHEEAYNEDSFFEDSNLEARQLTPLEGILHIRTALEEVQTDEQKREALIAMAECDNTIRAEDIPADASKAARMFNAAKYCLYYLSAELGIEGWSLSTVKAYMSIVNNSPEEVVTAVIEGRYKASVAREGTGFSAEDQCRLMNLWCDGETEKYRALFAALQQGKKTKKAQALQPGTRSKEAQKQLEASVVQLGKGRAKLTDAADGMTGEDRARLEKLMKRIDAALEELTNITKMNGASIDGRVG